MTENVPEIERIDVQTDKNILRQVENRVSMTASIDSEWEPPRLTATRPKVAICANV